MTTAIEGPCAVCGVMTTQRCSSCAQHGFDLFLCGREHQKLVWFAHKRVCGETSNPFTLPLLSVEEAKEIKGSLNESVQGPGESPQTLADLIQEATGYRKRQIPTLVDTLTVGKASGQYSCSKAFALTAWLRRSRMKMSVCRDFRPLPTAYAFSTDPESRHRRLVLAEPINAVSDFVAQLDHKHPYLFRTAFSNTGWYRFFIHHILITSALQYRYYSKTEAHHAVRGYNVKPNDPVIDNLLQLRTASRTPLLAALDGVREEEFEFADSVAQELALLPVFREGRVAVGGWVYPARMTRKVVRVEERLG